MDNPEQHAGKVVADGHCVRFLQEMSKTPHTSIWDQGIKAKGSNLPKGTCIATFGDNGEYENNTDGTSHAAVLVDQNDDGLVVYDQWKGHPVAQRTIRFKNGDGLPCDDGDQYYVID
jgi:hypothetical protein